MRKTEVSITICLLILTLSCNKLRNTQQESLDIFVHEIIGPKFDYIAIIIVPEFVCAKCNSYIFKYIEEILKLQQSTHIAIINMANKEKVQGLLSPQFWNAPNIFYIEKSNFNIEYPTIIYLRNGRLRKVEYQNSKNPYAFEKLFRTKCP